MGVLTFGEPAVADVALQSFLLERDMAAAAVLMKEIVGEDFRLLRITRCGAPPVHGGWRVAEDFRRGSRVSGAEQQPGIRPALVAPLLAPGQSGDGIDVRTDVQAAAGAAANAPGVVAQVRQHLDALPAGPLRTCQPWLA